jgi:acetate kinase
MAASLGGVDVVVLTGGIGEHDDQLRQELEHALRWLPALEILVVPADEEGLIARSCRRAAGSGRS